MMYNGPCAFHLQSIFKCAHGIVQVLFSATACGGFSIVILCMVTVQSVPLVFD